MNSHSVPTRRVRVRRGVDPVGFLTRRLSSIVVLIGAAAGLGIAATLDAAGLPAIGSLIVGVLVFAAGAVVAVAVPARSARTRRPEESPADPMQLGPDLEQVAGRRSGART